MNNVIPNRINTKNIFSSKDGNDTRYIIFLCFVALMISNLCLTSYFPPLVNLFGFTALFYLFIRTQHIWSYILILFFCSIFGFADIWGGLFVIINFFVFLFFKLFRSNLLKGKRIHSKDVWSDYLVGSFILFNIIGWVFINPMPLPTIFLGSIGFFSYILIFNYLRYLRISAFKLKQFLVVLVVFLFYSGLLAINQQMSVFIFDSPMFGNVDFSGSTTTGGAFGSSESFGEYGLFTYLILLTLSLSSMTKKTLKIKNGLLLIGITFALLSLIMSFSRSVFLLLFFSTILLFISVYTFRPRFINKKGEMLALIVGLSIFFIVIGPYIKLDYIYQRLSKINLGSINTETILSGSEINRDYAFSFALDRLNSESWWIGYGWGIRKSNRDAWFFNPKVERSDYHSLYLSLPMLYGWIGSVIFVLLIITPIVRTIKLLFTLKSIKDYRYMVLLGFLFAFVFFIINEFKISMMRLPGYFMVIWIFLGIYYSFLNDINSQLNKKGKI